MCVILVADTERIPEDTLNKAARLNGEGNGVAWREDGCVHWAKGISLPEVHKFAKRLPLPYIVHFRIATIGEKIPAMCHPFPVDAQASVATTGKTQGSVLFHNGTWHCWRDKVIEAAIKLSVKLPAGKWSDSRGLAWLTSYYNFLEVVDQKTAVLSPTELDLYGVGWEAIGESQGILASNRLFEFRTHNTGYYSGYTGPVPCKNLTCTRRSGLDKDGWCAEHAPERKPLVVVGEIDHADESMEEDAKFLEIVAGMGGVSASETPFMKALRLFKDGKISKRQFKKAKRAIDRQNLQSSVLALTH